MPHKRKGFKSRSKGSSNLNKRNELSSKGRKESEVVRLWKFRSSEAFVAFVVGSGRKKFLSARGDVVKG